MSLYADPERDEQVRTRFPLLYAVLAWIDRRWPL